MSAGKETCSLVAGGIVGVVFLPCLIIFYSLSGGIWVILLEISVIPLKIRARFSLAELTTNHPLDLRI